VAGRLGDGLAATAAVLDVSGPVVYLIRHAHAGDRTTWHGDDSQRPLSDKGWRQARGLVNVIPRKPALRRVLSSPSLRCVQTVEPLAEVHALGVETDDRLLEGADPADALALLEQELAAGGAVAACSHGDVIPGVLDLLRSAGVPIEGQLTWPKGSTWVLEGRDGGGVVRARYLPPTQAS
jgi:8-oxo-dGTP diphosphatase